jgi:prepilin peptidase CpaA
MLAFTPVPPAVAIALLIMLAVAAYFDVRYRRIPNWLSLAGLLLALVLHAILDPVWPGLRFSLAGFGLAFGIYIALYAVRAMGAGDVKIMAAAGAMLGWNDWLGLFIVTAILGGAAAIVLVISKRRLKKTLWNVGFVLTEMKSGRPAYLGNEELDVRSDKALGLPHGAVIAVSAAVFVVLVWKYGG